MNTTHKTRANTYTLPELQHNLQMQAITPEHGHIVCNEVLITDEQWMTLLWGCDPFQDAAPCWQSASNTILLDDGRIFPIYNGEILSWTLTLTWEDEKAGFPKLRTVIRAMIQHRPEQIRSERYEMLKGSFDRMFGHNAAKVLKIIDEETRER